MRKTFVFVSLLCVFLVTEPSAGNDEAFEKQLLDRHNVLRAKHGVAHLTWSKEIQRYAQEWAEINARDDRMHHRPRNKYGENIFWMSGGRPTGDYVVDAWYSEIKYYNFNKPGFNYKTGHFTQVVWKDSTKLGCGKAKSRRGGIYVVCNYSPAGNFMGSFRQNVPRLK